MKKNICMSFLYCQTSFHLKVKIHFEIIYAIPINKCQDPEWTGPWSGNEQWAEWPQEILPFFSGIFNVPSVEEGPNRLLHCPSKLGKEDSILLHLIQLTRGQLSSGNFASMTWPGAIN